MFVILRVFLIFLTVAILAGGIAMLGNQLGRKIGRKKMTVFGMRPRHTSIFITTITGSLIAVLTLGLAMIASQDVRDIITGSQKRIQKYIERENQLQVRVQELAEEVRKGTIIWNYRERIALNTIPAGASERQVRNIIGATLQRANFESIEKNNKVGRNQPEKVKFKPFGLDTILVKYTTEESRQWVKEYSKQERPVGLWIVVKENCLLRDPVPVTVESFPVDIIFREGAVVYETEILPDEVLFDWHVFLEQLKTEAIRKGMIEMNDNLGGEITAETLKQISQTVSQHKGRIRLQARANRNLYQSSNLDVSIEVEPVE